MDSGGFSSTTEKVGDYSRVIWGQEAHDTDNEANEEYHKKKKANEEKEHQIKFTEQQSTVQLNCWRKRNFALEKNRYQQKFPPLFLLKTSWEKG